MSSDKKPFTEREIQTLANAWLCIEGEYKIDFKKFAAKCGYTENSAPVMWRKLKAKLAAHAADDAASADSPGPKTPGKGGRKRAGDGEVEESPSKKTKGKTPSKKVATPKAKATKDTLFDEDVDEDVDEEFINLKIKPEEVEAVNNSFTTFMKEEEDTKEANTFPGGRANTLPARNKGGAFTSDHTDTYAEGSYGTF